MSKYKNLWPYVDRLLQAQEQTTLTLSFEEIQNVLGFEIDHSFLRAKKECLLWGYQVEKIHLKERKITFSKVNF
ncbi:MAG: hypothetical protein NC182_00230 [Prevotella sp.]|nr:hypothetical protein [Staphylococcus sp.]MCM1349610.1 hypothetical protein [Prevotella sp.]